MRTASALRSAPRYAAFAALAIAALALFALGAYEASRHSPWILPLPLAALAALGLGVAKEGRSLAACDALGSSSLRLAAGDGAAVFAASLVTYALSVELGLGPLAASALVGLLAALVAGRYAAAIYCGSFVGMACPLAYSGYPCLALSGAVAGLLYAASGAAFAGYGGKLGTVAFVGSLASAYIRSVKLHAAPVPDWELGWLVMLYAVAAALATYYLSVRRGRGPVMASATVGLAAAILLPALYGGVGSTLAITAFCASFVGMSSAERLPGARWTALAGLVCGAMFMFTTPWLGGAGGKLGTIAFGSAIAVSFMARPSLKRRAAP